MKATVNCLAVSTGVITLAMADRNVPVNGSVPGSPNGSVPGLPAKGSVGSPANGSSVDPPAPRAAPLANMPSVLDSCLAASLLGSRPAVDTPTIVADGSAESVDMTFVPDAADVAFIPST